MYILPTLLAYFSTSLLTNTNSNFFHSCSLKSDGASNVVIESYTTCPFSGHSSVSAKEFGKAVWIQQVASPTILTPVEEAPHQMLHFLFQSLSLSLLHCEGESS
eukprot:TRINITY_DN33437_c0_g1_i1.p1 TRINITY_DN33437_c0_g1~~TRINITY_DN33437_c0_g1_i1.p1  ORF type:complete len:104 (-),score=4.94 TRINITY_DN33437_c0_g1_i1:86-397(-)